MTEPTHRRHRIRAVLPIRVRGMSSQQKFFDETTETLLLSEHEIMTRLSQPVDLETELHVTALKSNLPGTYRVVWINIEPREGRHDVGLELMECEAPLWEMEFPPPAEAGQEELAQAWLACRLCGGKVFVAVPEAEEEFLREGFVVARPCDECKATTPWQFSAETAAAVAKEAEARKEGVDLRGKGRVPMRVRVKIIRKAFGSSFEEVCETENVSRTGAYFYSQLNYKPGELVEVILPFKEGDVAIPVPARIVRTGPLDKHYYRGVAIHLEMLGGSGQ